MNLVNLLVNQPSVRLSISVLYFSFLVCAYFNMFWTYPSEELFFGKTGVVVVFKFSDFIVYPYLIFLFFIILAVLP